MTVTLSALKILALDCQATGANPDKGHLLEIGWMPMRVSLPAAGEKSPVQAYLIRLQKDTEIPPPVKRITGISDTCLMAALATDRIWQYLVEAAKAVAAENQLAACPTVIHYARFEEPFLRELHLKNDPHGSFPFLIICTHAIAARLLPDLPRRSLRALAGYFSHSMPELKRSADHAVATALLWTKLVELLKVRCRIETLKQLTDWLACACPPGRSNRSFPMPPDFRRALPDKPGIYRMLRANGDLLYIGKAKSLRQRVNSYFRRKASHAEHTLEMLTQARTLDFTLTGSGLEAAILESDEIKRYSPPYNIALGRRQRALVFCTKGFSGRSAVADRHHAIGPLPDGKLIDALSAYGAWVRSAMRLADGDLLCLGHTLLSVSPAYAPQIQPLKAGLDLFQQKHRRVLANQSPLRGLTMLGAQLWRERRASLASAGACAVTEDENAELAEEQTESEEEFAWTPEALAAAVESMLMHGAHMIRRSRWFCLLSESSLAWASSDGRSNSKTLLVFENGSVLRQAVLNAGDKAPIPPGFKKSFKDRQKNVDIITYDRLRVVTTELRRLVTAGRHVELRMGPQVILGNQRLQKVLQWV
jgi:DNA polymerase-3 subunit epsilon